MTKLLTVLLDENLHGDFPDEIRINSVELTKRYYLTGRAHYLDSDDPHRLMVEYQDMAGELEDLKKADYRGKNGE